MTPEVYYGALGFAAAAGAFLLSKAFRFISGDCDLVCSCDWGNKRGDDSFGAPLQTLAAHQNIPNKGFEGQVVWITGASSGSTHVWLGLPAGNCLNFCD